MAAFRFSLEPLLKLRRLEEDRAKAGFLRALAGFRGKEAEIGELTAKREEAKERCRQSQPGRIDIEEVLRARRFINVLFQRISEKRVELNALRPALEEARSTHRRAASRRRAVERLRERRWREFQREEERRARVELDEAGQAGFIRAAAEGGRAPARGAER